MLNIIEDLQNAVELNGVQQTDPKLQEAEVPSLRDIGGKFRLSQENSVAAYHIHPRPFEANSLGVGSGRDIALSTPNNPGFNPIEIAFSRLEALLEADCVRVKSLA